MILLGFFVYLTPISSYLRGWTGTHGLIETVGYVSIIFGAIGPSHQNRASSTLWFRQEGFEHIPYTRFQLLVSRKPIEQFYVAVERKFD